MNHVVIIGGGPAGTAAALTLLKSQIRVSIVEREFFPRYRPGETLHPGIEPMLTQLGVWQELQRANYLRHDGVWSAWGEAPRFIPYGYDKNGPWRGFQALRDDLDRRMLESTCGRGAELITEEVLDVLHDELHAVVGIMTTRGPIRSDYVIDCSGGSQTFVRRTGIPITHYSPKLVARFGYVRGQYDGMSPLITADKTGWTWIAEVEPNRYQWTRVTEACNRPQGAWRPECLQGMIPESSRGADVTWRMAENVAGPGWYIAGDSAAVLDPASSHGVLRAVMTGMMSAHLVEQHLVHRAVAQNCAEFYQEWFTSWFHHDVTEMSHAYGSVGLFGFHSARN